MHFVLKTLILQNFQRKYRYQRLRLTITSECQISTTKHGRSFSLSLWRAPLCINTALFYFIREKKFSFFFSFKHVIHEQPNSGGIRTRSLSLYLANEYLILHKKWNGSHRKKMNKRESGFYASHLGERKLELNFLAWTGKKFEYQPPVYTRQLCTPLNLGVEEVLFSSSKKTSWYFSLIQIHEKSLFKPYNNYCSRNLLT